MTMAPVFFVTRMLRNLYKRVTKITGAVMMNFTVFQQKKIVKFIITAPVIFVTRMSRLCHNRDMKIKGSKTMNFAFFRTISEIHRFRSC